MEKRVLPALLASGAPREQQDVLDAVLVPPEQQGGAGDIDAGQIVEVVVLAKAQPRRA